MADSVTNFAKCVVSTGYDAAAVTVVLSSGQGSKLPTSAPYNLVWYNATDYPDPCDDPNVEIVRVTARTNDTLTVTRGADGTSAKTHNTSGKTYQMLLAMGKQFVEQITAKTNGLSNICLRVHLSADASPATSTQEVLHFDAMDLDFGPDFDLVDHRFEPSRFGAFYVTCRYTLHVRVSGIISTTAIEINVRKNGTIIATTRRAAAAGSSDRTFELNDVCQIQGSDYLDATIWHDQATGLVVNGAAGNERYTYFSLSSVYAGA